MKHKKIPGLDSLYEIVDCPYKDKCNSRGYKVLRLWEHDIKELKLNQFRTILRSVTCQ